MQKDKHALLAEKLNGETISDDLQRQITQYADNESLVIVNKDVAVVITSRSEWGSVGGIGYYDQVRVFCGSQADMKEWQWRDRYSADNDRPWLRVSSIGTVNVHEREESKVVIEVELVNKQHGNRVATYVFDQPKATTPALSEDEQKIFISQVEKEILRIQEELDRAWERRPKMLDRYPTTFGDGYRPYQRPLIKQREDRPEIGVSAFVVQEQIDHVGSDPQIRHELYVLTFGDQMAERKTESHGYASEGGALISIITIKPESIIINTKDGKGEISIL